MGGVKSRKVLPKDEYTFGMPTVIGGEVRPLSQRKSKHPWGIREGYHLVRVNSNTMIEVKDGDDDEKARQAFVNKVIKHNQSFYNNLEVQISKHLEV